MSSVFVKADPPEPKGIVFVKAEPLNNVLGKWLGWIVCLLIFLICLIYFSNVFAKPSKCRLNRTKYYDTDDGFRSEYKYDDSTFSVTHPYSDRSH